MSTCNICARPLAEHRDGLACCPHCERSAIICYMTDDKNGGTRIYVG